jgi:hypothetical protein
MTHDPEKPSNAPPAPDDPLDAEYRELMELAGPDGCKCGIPQCPGHEAIGGLAETAIETAPITEPDFDNPKCLCGIPGCEGHEDKGGFIEIPRLTWQLLFEREES